MLSALLRPTREEEIMAETIDTDALVAFVQEAFGDVADAENAAAMAAYLKTEMPFYGVKKPLFKPILKQLKARFAPADRETYEAVILALWELPHREEKHLAIEYGLQHKKFITSASLPLFEALIREGAWWDLVDPVAVNLVGVTLRKERDIVAPLMEAWSEDDDMWIRRSAILSHLKHKVDTDEEQLFDFCLRCIEEKEFFIRKAIGWALREFSKTAPEAVIDFLEEHKDRLSGLSYREGYKWLKTHHHDA